MTTLIIPTKNDDPAQIEGIAAFIAGLDPGIPLHLSAYHPQHEYTLPPTPAGTVRRLAEVARKHLKHVYAGNLGRRVLGHGRAGSAGTCWCGASAGTSR